MPYCVRDDVATAAGGAKRLAELSDYDVDGEEDDALVADAILEADALIDSNARKLFAVPFNPVPESIKRMSANLTVYILKGRRDALTEADLARHEERLEWLSGLRSGKVDPGTTNSPAASPHNIGTASERPSSKAVSRENLKGFA